MKCETILIFGFAQLLAAVFGGAIHGLLNYKT